MLFVVLQVNVFNVGSPMEPFGWAGLCDGMDFWLLYLWGMWIMALGDGWCECL